MFAMFFAAMLLLADRFIVTPASDDSIYEFIEYRASCRHKRSRVSCPPRRKHGTIESPLEPVTELMVY
jgi:hypothetical protein